MIKDVYSKQDIETKVLDFLNQEQSKLLYLTFKTQHFYALLGCVDAKEEKLVNLVISDLVRKNVLLRPKKGSYRLSENSLKKVSNEIVKNSDIYKKMLSINATLLEENNTLKKELDSIRNNLNLDKSENNTSYLLFQDGTYQEIAQNQEKSIKLPVDKSIASIIAGHNIDFTVKEVVEKHINF